MMRNGCKITFFATAITALTLLALFICEAEEGRPSPTLERGIGQYKHENYDEALITLKKAREEEPTSTLAAYYLGLTYKQLQNYKDAVTHLRDAVTYSPKIKGALIELIDCLYQVGQVDEAKKWIAEAEREAIRPAQVAFLKGLVMMKDENASEAVTAFEKAKELDTSMKQAADYQIGIAYLKLKSYDAAKEAFSEVVALYPSSNMANFANEYINALTRREEAARPFKFSFGAAWQYDDNVTLKPSDASLATDIADKADSREAYTANAEASHKFSDFFGVKGQYFFYYGKQNDLGFYDTVSNTFVFQPSLNFKTSLLSAPISYGHTVVNDKPYLSTPAVNGLYNIMIGQRNMAQGFVKYQYRDYLWTPSTDDEDRDGNDFGGGAGWYFFYAKNKGFVNLRYAFNRDWTKGNNWEYNGNRVTGAVLVPILENLNWTVTGDVYAQDFVNTHTVYNVHRRDKLYTVSTLLAFKFYKDSEIQLQYTFVNADSNISIYDYTRNISSAGVDIKF